MQSTTMESHESRGGTDGVQCKQLQLSRGQSCQMHACRKGRLRYGKRLTLIAHEEAVNDVQAGKRGVPVTLGCGGGL